MFRDTVQFDAAPRGSLTAGKKDQDNPKLVMCPLGVLVETDKLSETYLVPFSNIKWIRLQKTLS